MALDLLILIICFIALFIASFTDLKTREVPDWLNFSLIASGLGINLIASIIKNDWFIIVNSLAGLVFCLVIGIIMFYTGQWGGGDSKTIIGLGALIGLNVKNYRNIFLIFSDNFLISFLINVLFVGAIYGLVWIFVLGIKNRRKITKRIKIINKNRSFKGALIFLSIVVIILIILVIFVPYTELKVSLLLLLIFTVILSFLWVFAKSVEEIAMIKSIPVEKLTEGDWIVKDVIINKKRITGPKDLGISKEQIKTLLKLKSKGKIKNIEIKEGIPFVPSFLVAFIITLLFGNVLFSLLLYF